MKKQTRSQIITLTLILIATFSVAGCNDSNTSISKEPAPLGRTVTGKLGDYYEGGYVLAYDGSGMQSGCQLPKTATYKTEDLINTDFNCTK